MKRRLSCVFCFLLVASGCARAHITPTVLPRAPERKPSLAQPLAIAPPSQRIPLGEELEYSISWWGIPVGTVIATATQAKPSEVGLRGSPFQKRLIKLDFRARSNSYLQAFYPVRVELISLLDSDTQTPVRFQASVKRRWRLHESVVTFDWQKGTAFHQLPKKRTATVPVNPTTQDGLSMVYYARRLDFSVGQRIPLEITADGKNWNLDGRILRTGRMELKKLGSWPTVEGSVELAYPVPFFQGAKVHIWFSADEERIPLLAKIRSRIGPVTVVLIRRSQGSAFKIG